MVQQKDRLGGLKKKKNLQKINKVKKTEKYKKESILVSKL